MRWVHGFLAVAAVVWVVPLWMIPFPPMLDYPQQLAVAAIVRWIGDPAWGFGEAYELALGRPQGLFEMVTAGLAWVMPIQVAGKLVLSLSIAGVLPAAVALCRRTGRPEWYALLALAVTYNHTFYWGFVDSLVAYPLFLGAVALADRLLDARFGLRSWLLLAGSVALFYTVHLQMLLLLAGAVGWLALVRQPPVRRLALQLSALLPGVALGAGVLGWAHLHAAEVMTRFQQRIGEEPTVMASTGLKVGRVSGLLFGEYSDGSQALLFTVLLAALLVLVARLRFRPNETETGGDILLRTRFATLAGWVAMLYFLLPEFTRGYLVAGRLVPVVVMLAACGLPIPSRNRRWAALALTVLLLAFQLQLVVDGFRTFAVESAGLDRLLEQAEPGQALAGLLYERRSSVWGTPEVMAHFPAYYQACKGGRVLLSFVQFFNAPVRYRPGANWEGEILARRVNWFDPYGFDTREAARFRYLLIRGGRENLRDVLGPGLANVSVSSAGRWHLVDLRPGTGRP